MDYEKFKEVFIEAKKKYKYRCIACLLCIPVWVLLTHTGSKELSWFSQGDAVGTIILLCLAVMYADRGARANINLKRVRLLQGKTKITVLLEKVFHNHKEVLDPKAIARLVKDHIAHLGKVEEVTYETPLEKKKL